ncbi:RAD55 family ATPase [Halosegnis marinus]|uniref:RAD55 family ATPase n=1 Tax=Halosegnis marinus TaxID=3034023 RepID=UPI003608EE49
MADGGRRRRPDAAGRHSRGTRGARSGGPGTGKTTFAMQFLQEGIATGERCLFVSTEQTREELRDSFAGYEFDLDHELLGVTTLHPSPRERATGTASRSARWRAATRSTTARYRSRPRTSRGTSRARAAATGWCSTPSPRSAR